ncbi:MAG: nucleotidyltransferase family protein [Phycisphaerae bacterium]|nr:nucleotidyltransferase family protein [Phycisphaerae bacterium]MBT5383137.1 nucleotidyltransferase family protein [Phycisphaerae bacterium]MBT5582672.1 nucleotidyltransferase family protein [Phycisphaerae bacterium]MBT5657524.1 nucleotidyltransferase family protein [Phycisphaerae bacterium]
MSLPYLVGLLLAAGRSKRMGEQTKQLLPWPSPGSARTIIETSFDLLAPFCSSMFVVLDHDAEAITTALGDREYTLVQGDADAPMFESIRGGLQAIASHQSEASVLLHPADHPGVLAATIQKVVDNSVTHPDQAIIPHHGDRGGHPVLVPHTLHARILTFDGRDGLRGFWQSHPDCYHRIAVDDPTMIMDVDTMEQYRSQGGHHS